MAQISISITRLLSEVGTNMYRWQREGDVQCETQFQARSPPVAIIVNSRNCMHRSILEANAYRKRMQTDGRRMVAITWRYNIQYIFLSDEHC